MARPAWSWADYERCKRAEERKAAKRAAAAEAEARARHDAASAAALERIKARSGGRQVEEVEAQEVPTADDASGCKGRAPEGSSGPAPVGGQLAPVSPSHVAVKARQSRVEYEPRPQKQAAEWRGDRRPLLARMREASPGGKIDITAAPSGMEAAASRWEGKGHASGRLAQSVPILCEGKALCRCGAQGPGQTRGPVPMWFGEKCIETNCELRGRHELSA